MNLKGKSDMLEGILALGMDGIEAFSSYHTPSRATRFYQKALERGLLVTCGNDFHGKTKPSIQLGGAVFAQEMDSEEQAALIANALISRQMK